MKRTLRLAITVALGVLSIAITLIALTVIKQFTNVGKSMMVQEKLESFIASKDATSSKLSELFPWPWTQLCSTGDIAGKEVFEGALGRNATVRESLEWYWNGSWMWPMSEGTDNLIFIGPEGTLNIYQYTYFGKAPINFRIAKEKMPHRCIPNSEKLVIAKDVESQGTVTQLNVTETK